MPRAPAASLGTELPIMMAIMKQLKTRPRFGAGALEVPERCSSSGVHMKTNSIMALSNMHCVIPRNRIFGAFVIVCSASRAVTFRSPSPRRAPKFSFQVASTRPIVARETAEQRSNTDRGPRPHRSTNAPESTPDSTAAAPRPSAVLAMVSARSAGAKPRPRCSETSQHSYAVASEEATPLRTRPRSSTGKRRDRSSWHCAALRSSWATHPLRLP
mmetsp:Transcript_4921/g.7960  ORF Transcript_4921/g.7960 Transcript_4921/m.7960 type:complete len:215 (-) Transcript_4921:110-754(-)